MMVINTVITILQANGLPKTFLYLVSFAARPCKVMLYEYEEYEDDDYGGGAYVDDDVHVYDNDDDGSGGGDGCVGKKGL